MVRFYCPGCWKDFGENLNPCPHCGLDIREFWNSKDWIEKLILALHHPEPSTPVRAAWLVGRIGDQRAIGALIRLIEETDDIYIARAAVKALGEIGGPEAVQFLRSLTGHAVQMIRDEAKAILDELKGAPDTFA